MREQGKDTRDKKPYDNVKSYGFSRRKYSARSIPLIAVLLSLVVVIGFVERSFPLDFIVPGARLGISNIVIVISLYVFPRSVTALLTILKCLLLSALAGGFSSFIYSFSGSVLALITMALTVYILRERISPIGVSTVGAVFHGVGQVSMAAIIIQNTAMYYYLPILTIISVASGLVVGILARLMIPRAVRILEGGSR